MKTRRLLAAAGAAVCAAAVVGAAAGAVGDPQHFRRPLHAGSPKAKQQPPAPFSGGEDPCEGIDPSQLPPGIPAPTNVFGSDFDPAHFDEISVAGDGRLLAFATLFSPEGVPTGATKQIVLLTVGSRAKPIALEKVAAEDDQPSVQVDSFGRRCAFRSSAAADGGRPSNIQLVTLSRAKDAAPVKVAVTEITDGSLGAFDPALAARTRVREIAAGVTVKEQDARVAFVSDANLDGNENPLGAEQLFLWEERGLHSRQITRNDDVSAHINRPSIAKSGDVIVFESTADLDPGSHDPANTSREGNPDGRRQIFRWRRGAGVEQITWVTDGDCFSPRMDLSGRFVLFSCNGDPITGGNPLRGEPPARNFEIFRWTANGARLEQLTDTTSGNNGLPRPTSRPDVFAFYSTSEPPADAGAAFTGPTDVCLPQALVYDRGRIVHVQSFTTVLPGADKPSFLSLADNNIARATGAGRTTAQRLPVLAGPPVTDNDGNTVFFATNDFRLTPPAGGTGRPRDEVDFLSFFVALARRHAGR